MLPTPEPSLALTGPSSAAAHTMFSGNSWISGMAMRITSAEGRAKPLAR